MNMPINHGKEWTKQNDASLLNYKKNKHTIQQIASYMGRSEYAIECRLIYLKEQKKEKPIITHENAKKYLAILYAFTKGKTIEMLSGNTWLPITSFMFSKPIDNYRIQPPKKWYRLARVKCDGGFCFEVVGCQNTEKYISQHENFVCWLTERIEYV